jgi:hypothetical protein
MIGAGVGVALPAGPVGVGRWAETAPVTAARVLQWAAAPRGPVPLGTLRRSRDLVADPGASRRLRDLVRSTAARTGAGAPPLGDPSPLGAGAILLAASVGGRSRPDLAARLAATLPPPPLEDAPAEGWADALARHAVVGAVLPAVGNVPDDLARSWLDGSPLTAALYAPHAEGIHAGMRTAVALARRPRGPAVLTASFADCHADPKILHWRGEVLLRLAAQHPHEVLDVYLAARTWHGHAWDVRAAEANRALALASRIGTTDADALAVVHYWAGLTIRAVTELVTGSRLPVDLRPWLTFVRHHPAAGVSDL